MPRVSAVVRTVRTVLIVPVALVALALVGCGSQPPPVPPSPATSATPTPTPSDGGFMLEDVAQFPNGLEVSTEGTEVRQVLAGESGAESSAGQVVVVSILITNGTGDAYDPTSAVITASYGAADTPAPMVSDSKAELQSGFNDVIPQGEEATAPIGFAIPTAGLARVTITVALNDDENNPVSFTGKVDKA